ncbi:bumetanide-sensitive sodium-(potassium)-chloride cotransporter-like [Macrosteles quadrilineatus]|uniref:bumetanide-sensitive sodium-(potassium)-chloride cotransporter-like n=1 Tax=Macrosteles quadrilineatus TaxID=74068 RepID=UPI0023E0CF9D|nr:bumetanide-sensitive sodium-(potassium)-chloride cotransporter-like [Macrosteles quadrilineatus]
MAVQPRESDKQEKHASWDIPMVEMEHRFRVDRVDGGVTDDDAASGTEDEDDVPGNYTRSFRHITREALPRLDNYRNILSIQAVYRPTLDELHNPPTGHHKATVIQMNGKTQVAESEAAIKFGWIKGVLVRNLLNIWGVMLFLRLSWVVGQAGILEGIFLILSTTVVTGITSLSMSAICTNGLIKGGGTYFMISRSLGPEFGASIGLIFSLANAVACAMYTVGFCESLLDLLRMYEVSIVDGGVQDMRIIGCVTILLLLCIVVIGMEWEAKTQMGLLVILVLAIADFFIGSFIGPKSDEVKAKGFLGLSVSLVKDNLMSDYRPVKGENHDFFSVFAVFFPAASGFLAGANISGDLRDPTGALPKGTILSIVITTTSYVVMAFMMGASVLRDASGKVEEYFAGNFTDCATRKCDYGLQNNFQVVELVSVFGPLIFAGCFAATLSSALASLVSAPKVFQALCKDKLYPYVEFFGKGYGKNHEPIRGYVLTFFIAICLILVGDLNAIAPLISNFFLAAYALINFSTFHASLIKPIGWRPTFKYYNCWLSLLGSVLCCVVMFLISWAMALFTFAAMLTLYLLVAYRKPDVNWGSSTQAQIYHSALASVHQLSRVEDHVKNYRPQILVFCGLPSTRPPLIDFAHLITKNVSLLACANIIKVPVSQKVQMLLSHKARSWLLSHKIKAFYSQIDGCAFQEGARALMAACGLGKLKPNIVLLGYKSDWATCDRTELTMYFNTVHKALDLYLAVAILRVQEGLDYSKILADEFPHCELNGAIPESPASSPVKQPSEPITRDQSYSDLSQEVESSGSELSAPNSPRSPRVKTNGISSESRKKKESRTDLFRGINGNKLSKNVINNLTQFQRKQKKGTIDVWWLYDDGGLTLLLPYIISTRRNWENCKLRVFTIANKKDELQFEQRNMASLLAKFRIDYSDLKVITDVTKKPQDSTVAYFDELIKNFKATDEKRHSASISEAELVAMTEKTNRHLRLRELLLEYSSTANLIVMTQPMPRKNVESATLYMAWLETLTKDMPPFLLVRGNQQSVLTFYS